MPVIREAWQAIRDVQRPAPDAVASGADRASAASAQPTVSTGTDDEHPVIAGSLAADDQSLVCRMHSLLDSLRSGNVVTATGTSQTTDPSQTTVGDVIRSLRTYNAQLGDADAGSLEGSAVDLTT